MPKKQNWLWTIFFWLYLFTVLSNTVVFFNPESPTKLFYKILLSFDSAFLVPYLFNLLAIILDVLAIIPFYNFLDPAKNHIGKNSISPKTWKWFFAIRFALLFIGHTYEIKEIQSVVHNNSGVTFYVLTILLLLQVPSHIAVFLYSYRQKH